MQWRDSGQETPIQNQSPPDHVVTSSHVMDWKRNTSSFAESMTTKLGMVETKGNFSVELHNLLIKWSHWGHVTNKNVLSPLLQDLWPPKLAEEIHLWSHTTLRSGDYMITLLFGFMSEFPLPLAIILPGLVAICFAGVEILRFLFFHLISPEHAIRWSCDFISGGLP